MFTEVNYQKGERRKRFGTMGLQVIAPIIVQPDMDY